jgi:hypothetical protein
MKMMVVLGAAGGALVAVGVAISLFCGACSSSDPPPSGGAMADAGGNACTADAGEFPTPNCDNTPESCMAPATACPTAPCNGSSPCLAMADNGGKTTEDFRLRKLNVTAPPRLALQFIQAAVIDQGINLKNLCGEGGDGSFNWLLRFDMKNNQLTTGGAPNSSDPFHVGYCFANETVGALSVMPVTATLRSNGGVWATDTIPKIFVPIYDPENGGVPIILPLAGARLQGVTISPDGNCIGSYNPDGVSSPTPGTSTCIDQAPALCERWHTAGSLGGYITLQEAEQVYVRQEQETLCALLTVGLGSSNCPKDASGTVTPTGDFCSKTNQPGGCADSYWLAATFAASAVLIDDSPTDMQCTGEVVGADGGSIAAIGDGGMEDGATD